jgi:hypothetical protein
MFFGNLVFGEKRRVQVFGDRTAGGRCGAAKCPEEVGGLDATDLRAR